MSNVPSIMSLLTATTPASITTKKNRIFDVDNQKPSFKPEINKRSARIASQKKSAPLYSNERYKKTLNERNQKMEELKRKR